MADGNRLYPVDRLVLHHSAGPDFKNVGHDEIAKWFSDIGRNRGYKGIAHSGHTYKGKETFAQAQYAGHWHNNKYCIFPIMDDPWNNVAWHAGNWWINQKSIGIENCGNYVGKTFTDAQRRITADFWRPQDTKLKGKTYINPHSAFSATACPGKIKDAIPTIIKYINDPPKPPEPPKPVDPCKAVKDELARTRSQLATATQTIETLNSTTQAQEVRIDAQEQAIDDLLDVVASQEQEIEELELALENCGGEQPKCTIFVIIRNIIESLRRK